MSGRFIVRNAAHPEWVPGSPVLTIGMGYEFDPAKDEINRIKHGYGLESGEDLLRRLTFPLGRGPPVVGLAQPDRIDNESRYRILTLDHESHLVDFVFTVRGKIGDNYRLRAISYRRASYDPILLSIFLPHVTSGEISDWVRQCTRDQLTGRVRDWPVSNVVQPERRGRLLELIPLPDLVAVLLEHARPEADGEDSLLERAQSNDVTDFRRLRVRWEPTTRVGERAMDHLFNGHGGLRYCYAIAPLVGEMANRYILDSLATESRATWAGLPADEHALAMESYQAPSAKIWPAEYGLDLRAPAEAEVALAMPRWVRARDAWAHNPQEESYLAGWGVQAPQPALLEIKGGFINAAQTVWIPQSKDHRAEHVYRWGWS